MTDIVPSGIVWIFSFLSLLGNIRTVLNHIRIMLY
jgi:hypothetical protein